MGSYLPNSLLSIEIAMRLQKWRKELTRNSKRNDSIHEWFDTNCTFQFSRDTWEHKEAFLLHNQSRYYSRRSIRIWHATVRRVTQKIKYASPPSLPFSPSLPLNSLLILPPSPHGYILVFFKHFYFPPHGSAVIIVDWVSHFLWQIGIVHASPQWINLGRNANKLLSERITLRHSKNP